MRNRTILITGATGIMGSWVLGEALERGYEPTVLMRDASTTRAKERIEAVLRLSGREDKLEQVRIIHGDTRLPDMGLESVEVARLRSTLGSMIHCAASTTFSPRRDAEVTEAVSGMVDRLLRGDDGGGSPPGWRVGGPNSSSVKPAGPAR